MPVKGLHQRLEDPRDVLDQYAPRARQATSRKQDGQVTLTVRDAPWL